METKEYFEKEMFFESLRLPLDKISCTRQFESKLSLRSFAKSLDKGSSTSQSSETALPESTRYRVLVTSNVSSSKYQASIFQSSIPAV